MTEEDKQILGKNLEVYTEIKNSKLDALNRNIFIISTGGFVLSVSLISWIKTPIFYPFLLILSWFLIFIVIISNSFALWLMIKDSERRSYITNSYRVGKITNIDYNKVMLNNEDPKLKKLEKRMTAINWIVPIILVTGIVCLILFASINLIIKN